MKRCPICKTTLFDDMPTCFGCMYQFGSKPELELRLTQEAACDAAAPHAETGALKGCAANAPEGCLLGEFLEKFERFMRDFLVDARIQVE